MGACSKWHWLVPASTTCATVITTYQWSIPAHADGIGFIFQVDSGSAATLVCKMQEKIGDNWADIASASISSVTSAGAARYFLTANTTGIVRFVITPGTPSTLKVSAAVIWSATSR